MKIKKMVNRYNVNDLYRKIINHPTMRSNPSLLSIKGTVVVLLGLLVLGIFPPEAFSQEIVHQYKITGAKRIFLTYLSSKERMVEYDPSSADHLFISELVDNGVIVDKSQFLFKGNKFNLRNLKKHDDRGELVRDGVQRLYNPDKSFASELIYKNGTLLQQTFFYTNGEKQMTFLGDQKALNGEFIMWYPNGQISFQGRYKINQKDGEFASFDESGNLERKGTYKQGKLILGESVVQDLLYDAPEVPAQLIEGNEVFNEFLRIKTKDMTVVKEMVDGEKRMIDFKLNINKSGKINKTEVASSYLDPADMEILNAAFQECTGFKPALLEGAPVRSMLTLSLYLTNQGLQTNIQKTVSLTGDTINAIYEDSRNDDIYTIVEEMPEFSGGETDLRKFLALNVRYPAMALEKKIQGKVFVSFVIQQDGTVRDISILRSVHPLLDMEAMRVVKQMPKWKPGRQNGKPVKVQYTIPINFVIQ